MRRALAQLESVAYFGHRHRAAAGGDKFEHRKGSVERLQPVNLPAGAYHGTSSHRISRVSCQRYKFPRARDYLSEARSMITFSLYHSKSPLWAPRGG